VTHLDRLTSVNLLFDHQDNMISVQSPYTNHGKLVLRIRERRTVRVRLSERLDQSELSRSLDADGIKHHLSGRWLYLTDLTVGQDTGVVMPWTTEEEQCSFNGHSIQVRWNGDAVTAMSSQGKRLCFFPDLEGQSK
jgi:hypothetical protein